MKFTIQQEVFNLYLKKVKVVTGKANQNFRKIIIKVTADKITFFSRISPDFIKIQIPIDSKTNDPAKKIGIIEKTGKVILNLTDDFTNYINDINKTESITCECIKNEFFIRRPINGNFIRVSVSSDDQLNWAFENFQMIDSFKEVKKDVFLNELKQIYSASDPQAKSDMFCNIQMTFKDNSLVLFGANGKWFSQTIIPVNQIVNENSYCHIPAEKHTLIRQAFTNIYDFENIDSETIKIGVKDRNLYIVNNCIVYRTALAISKQSHIDNVYSMKSSAKTTITIQTELLFDNIPSQIKDDTKFTIDLTKTEINLSMIINQDSEIRAKITDFTFSGDKESFSLSPAQFRKSLSSYRGEKDSIILYLFKGDMNLLLLENKAKTKLQILSIIR